jgi:hypothetical protein
MPASLRPGAPRSKGHPPNPQLGPPCTWIQAALAQSLTPRSATGWQRTLIGYHSGPCKRLRCQYGPRVAPPPRAALPPRETSCWTFPTPSPRPGWQSSIRPLARHPPPIAQPISPQAVRRPPTVGRSARPGQKEVQGSGHRPSPGFSRRECHSSSFQNLTTSSSAISTIWFRWVSSRARFYDGRHRCLEHGKLLGHLSMMEGIDLHSL